LLMVSFSRSHTMQRFVLLFALCASETSGGSVRGSGSVSTSDGLERPHHGFADADTDSDASFKVMSKKKMHGRHGGHREVQRSSGSLRSRQIQHQIEQMLSRVKHLHDEEASVAFVKELDEIEEELSSSTEDEELAQEVDNVRADLCTQQNLMDVGLDTCESFMDKSCSKRPLKVPSHFCTRFLRQQKRRQRKGGATTQDDAIKFAASDASAEAEVANEGATEAEVSNEGAAEAESESPAPAAAGGPAPGPVPMGPYFGGKAVRPLPEQGFEGELKEPYRSEDQMVQNWQREFGPKAGHRTFEDICHDFKGNEWCRLHGYYDHPERKGVIEEIVDEVEGAGSGSGSGRGGNKSGAARHSFIAILAVGAVSGLTLF